MRIFLPPTGGAGAAAGVGAGVGAGAAAGVATGAGTFAGRFFLLLRVRLLLLRLALEPIFVTERNALPTDCIPFPTVFAAFLNARPKGPNIL